MHALLQVALKEIKDNLRDRRSLFSAILYPALFPCLMLIPMILSISSNWIDFDKATELHVTNSELAPNLVTFLTNNNFDVLPAPDNFKQRIHESDMRVVLDISSAYGERLRQGKPAPLVLYANHASKKSMQRVAQVRQVLWAYNQTLAAQRWLVRGLDPGLNQVIDFKVKDVSNGGLSEVIFIFSIYFSFMAAMVFGGSYLASDITPGERERKSLEPLLSLPLSRAYILMGKWLAVLFFILLPCCLAALSIFLIVKFYPAGPATDLLNINNATLFKSLLVILPSGLVFSGLMVALSAFIRSIKEAQTYIGFISLVPLAPGILGQFLEIKPTLFVYFVPFLGHNELIGKLIEGQPILEGAVAASVLGSFGVTALFFGYRHLALPARQDIDVSLLWPMNHPRRQNSACGEPLNTGRSAG